MEMKKMWLVVLIILYIIVAISMIVSMKPGQVIPGSYSAAKEDSFLSVFLSLSAIVLVVLMVLYGIENKNLSNSRGV